MCGNSPSSVRPVKKIKAASGDRAETGVSTVSTMVWTSLLLVLLSHCTGSLSQSVLTQPPSLSASLEALARLTCTLSSGISVGGKIVYWYQQKPGSNPRYLLSYYSESSKHQGSGVPSRFSGSKDASTNSGILHVSGLQPEDEADYYCKIWHDSINAYTVLQTHREVRKKPSPHSPSLAPSPCWWL
uniref:Ig-like domain-containing protein n=1 Tax=Macaca fascicularis TaxID=9541 RepID=A0A7N9DFV9_MACFA